MGPNEIKNSQKIEINIDNEEKKLNESNNNIKNENETNKNKSDNDSNIEDENKIINYDDLDKDNDYYITCKNCKKYIPHIENGEYDSKNNDFLVEYICPCNSSNNNIICYLRELITENEPSNECMNHKENRLSIFCKNCNKKICEKCKEEEHIEHEYDYNDILSNEKAEEIFKIAEEKKDQFKGFEIFKKLFEKYIKNSEKIDKNNLNEENETNKENENINEARVEYEDDIDKLYKENNYKTETNKVENQSKNESENKENNNKTETNKDENQSKNESENKENIIPNNIEEQNNNNIEDLNKKNNIGNINVINIF